MLPQVLSIQKIMLLSNLSKYIDCKKIYNLKKKEIYFNNVYSNSYYIKQSSILIVDVNKKFKNQYIKNSIKKGAVALISNKYHKNILLPQFIVDNINKNKNLILKKLFYMAPKNSIGITGTNGKTSTVWFASQICYLNNILVKSYGTLGYHINSIKKEESILTTPDYEVLYQRSFKNKKKNSYNFIFEVSSHALKQKRLNDFPIDIAAITNISHDHLDYHKNFIDYKKSKFKLINYYLKDNGIAIINDNLIGVKSLKIKLKKNKTIISYGKIDSNVSIINKKDKTQVKIFNKKYLINFLDYSEIEFENVACAICCCLSLGISEKKIINVLHRMQKPKGRLEEIYYPKNNSKIYIDYAHTPEALKKILIAKTYKNIKPNILFGCGGNRDKSKRPKMGKIANKHANNIFITDDNPRDEDSAKIRKDILKNCNRAIEIADRKKAIESAIKLLKKNEILIIAGKGHENQQIIKNKKNIFDDLKVTKSILSKLK